MGSSSLNPVFVGGTGRSGSTIVGDLLDHHPAITVTIPMEVRFITGNNGIADALAKAGKPARLKAAELAVDRIHNRWFFRTENVGLHTSMSREFVTETTDRYLAHFENSPQHASQVLVYSIMEKVALGCDAERWVDTTPANARKANLITPIYPQHKVIVMVRDGRDVAASFVHQDFGPSDVFEAVALWEKRMIKSDQAVKRCAAGVVLTLDLQDLVVTKRDASLDLILEHCELDDSLEMRDWFNVRVTPDGAHAGRWRRDFDDSTGAVIDKVYSDSCDRLRELGISIPVSGE
ncbi:MAG: sulfotransferase [Candidatus Nanopelagicales bacterium]|nr:sulfotransferase [Candidatus Nanopelagicales bacterium]MDE1046378.1 sulfotransferase [Candidatus Nanopelagicales bacterium]